jgi:hypothetical protein
MPQSSQRVGKWRRKSASFCGVRLTEKLAFINKYIVQLDLDFLKRWEVEHQGLTVDA